MGLEIIETKKAPAAIGPYSQGISAGPWHFVSGQLGLDPETGELVSDALTGQAHQALKNLKQVVEACGCSLNNVVAVDVFLTDMGEFITFNGIYQEYFNEHKPARAVVEVRGLPKGACIEIKCIVHG